MLNIELRSVSGTAGLLSGTQVNIICMWDILTVNWQDSLVPTERKFSVNCLSQFGQLSVTYPLYLRYSV